MIVDTTRMSSRGQIVLPLEIRQGIEVGDKLIILRKGDDIILKKTIPETTMLSEKSFAKTWLNKKEDDAWKDL
jgi:AbrB family looped-hinge helix DNA binding protein